jgi:hypothetical protein
MEVCPQSMTLKLLHLVFSTTGIFPYNDTLFTDIDFAPAKSFSHTMHVPQSFPPEVLTSSPIASNVSDVEMSSNESDSAESVAADAPAAQTLFSWGTDSDDFNFEDPQPSHFTAPAAAVMPTGPQRPHAPCVSFLPCLPFLLHPLCPIMWVHLSCRDHRMPPLEHVTSLIPKLLKCQASVLVPSHCLPSQFLSPLILPRCLNCNPSRSCWEKTVA